jgi:acetylornithine/N-succinyldiaminopimelate aminotransferase
MEGSFHGRTLATTAATGQPKYQAHYEPLPAGFRHVPFADAGAVRDAIGAHTAAVLLEPVQGEGGILVPPAGYLAQVREICDEAGVLLILDEVQTGVGRTGTFFAYEQEGVLPDIVTLAKGLGGGVPIGAMIASPEVARGFAPGAHASTFGGGPLACAAANAVLDTVAAEGLLDNAKAMGEYLQDLLRDASQSDGIRQRVRAVRGRGLMVGVEVHGISARDVTLDCAKRGLLVNVAGATTVRLVPPLVIGKGHVRAAVEILMASILDAPEASG